MRSGSAAGPHQRSRMNVAAGDLAIKRRGNAEIRLELRDRAQRFFGRLSALRPSPPRWPRPPGPPFARSRGRSPPLPRVSLRPRSCAGMLLDPPASLAWAAVSCDWALWNLDSASARCASNFRRLELCNRFARLHPGTAVHLDPFHKSRHFGVDIHHFIGRKLGGKFDRGVQLLRDDAGNFHADRGRRRGERKRPRALRRWVRDGTMGTRALQQKA